MICLGCMIRSYCLICTLAVEAIDNAIANGEHIAVFGDYDVDGITSTCVLVRYLKSRGAACRYYIPDRLSEGIWSE